MVLVVESPLIAVELAHWQLFKLAAVNTIEFELDASVVPPLFSIDIVIT